ncbi:receptor-like kinase TMK4, partial [Tanacetum coccineum]
LSYSNLTGELRLNNQKQGLSGTLDVVSLTLQLTGLVPALLVSLPKLANITLHNNKLQGPVPEFKSAVKVDKYQNKNSFCLSKPGPCDPQVSVLLDVAGAIGYPYSLATSWTGNDACKWNYVFCDNSNKVTIVNFVKQKFSGTISLAFANLTSLRTLSLNDNNFGDTPVFPPTVKFLFGGNPNIGTDVSNTSGSGSGSGSGNAGGGSNGSKKGSSGSGMVIQIVISVIVFVVILLFVSYKCYAKKRNQKLVKIKDPESGKEIVKASVIGSSSNAHSVGGNVDISIYDLRQVTDNFSDENILGRGEFRVVYKGELHDGTKIAVKRMEASVMGIKGLKEFQAEILVLTKVRHRHLLALLGYCVNDLKPYNILLGDDMRAKVADFGLVNAPDKDGKFSTKLSDTDDEERLESIYKVAELAGHCTARNPYQRPDMGHAVYVLGPLVEQWKPSRPEEDDGDPSINLNTSLSLLVRRWETR